MAQQAYDNARANQDDEKCRASLAKIEPDEHEIIKQKKYHELLIALVKMDTPLVTREVQVELPHTFEYNSNVDLVSLVRIDGDLFGLLSSKPYFYLRLSGDHVAKEIPVYKLPFTRFARDPIPLAGLFHDTISIMVTKRRPGVRNLKLTIREITCRPDDRALLSTGKYAMSDYGWSVCAAMLYPLKRGNSVSINV